MTRRPWFALLALLLPAFAFGTDKKVDALGDPLPDGAILRLGTARLRSPSHTMPDSIRFSELASDGKFLIGHTPNGEIVFVDSVTGKTIRTVKVGTPVARFSDIWTFSGDSTRAVTSGAEKDVIVLNATDGKVLARLTRNMHFIHDVVALSGDGKRLAIGPEVVNLDNLQQPKSILIWDVDADKQVAIVKPYQPIGVRLALSPDGKRMVTWNTKSSVGVDKKGGFGAPPKAKNAAPDPAKAIQLWDTDTGKELAKVWIGERTTPIAAAFSPTSTLVAASNGDGSIRLFDATTGEEKKVLQGQNGIGRRMAFSPDGKILAASPETEVVQRWSLADGRLLDTTESPLRSLGHTAYATPRSGNSTVLGLAFTDNARVVAWGKRDEMSMIWEAPSGKPVSPTEGHTAPVCGITATADGKEWVSVAKNGAVIRWDATTGKQLGTAAFSITATNASVLVSPDGSRMLVGGSRQPLCVNALPNGTRQFVIAATSATEATRVIGTFSSDGGKIATFTPGLSAKIVASRVVTVWDVTGEKKLNTIELPGEFSFTSATVAPDGKSVVTIGTRTVEGKHEFVVTGWEFATGKKLGELTEEVRITSGGQVVALGDNKSAFVVTPDGSVFVIDFKTGKKVFTPELGGRAMRFVAPAVAPDGKTIAVLVIELNANPQSSGVVVIDSETGKIKKTLVGISGQPSAVAFSPNGKTLLTGSHDTTVLVWDLTMP